MRYKCKLDVLWTMLRWDNDQMISSRVGVKWSEVNIKGKILFMRNNNTKITNVISKIWYVYSQDWLLVVSLWERWRG